jgi:thiamine-monophosphate kinase
MPATDGPTAPDADEEDWVIARLSADRTAPPTVAVGIGDDAALFADGRVVTVDTMVEGVHWDDKLSPGDVGWKLVAVNVSDVGAMGGRPEWALLAMSLPSPLDRLWVNAFAEGLHAACAHWGVALIGGDTSRGPARSLSLTVGGHAARPVLRSTGRPDDDIWVTGKLGRSAEAFLANAPRPEALAHFRRPVPPVAFGAALAEAGLATAMMDLSDGLSRDLDRLCLASGCGAVVYGEVLPGDAPLDWRVAFGEDYELLFCAAQEDRDAVRSVARMQDVAISRIGRLEARPGLRLASGGEWPRALFSHFARPPRAAARSRRSPTEGAP